MENENELVEITECMALDREKNSNYKVNDNNNDHQEKRISSDSDGKKSRLQAHQNTFHYQQVG